MRCLFVLLSVFCFQPYSAHAGDPLPWSTLEAQAAPARVGVPQLFSLDCPDGKCPLVRPARPAVEMVAMNASYCPTCPQAAQVSASASAVAAPAPVAIVYASGATTRSTRTPVRTFMSRQPVRGLFHRVLRFGGCGG